MVGAFTWFGSTDPSVAAALSVADAVVVAAALGEDCAVTAAIVVVRIEAAAHAAGAADRTPAAGACAWDEVESLRTSTTVMIATTSAQAPTTATKVPRESRFVGMPSSAWRAEVL